MPARLVQVTLINNSDFPIRWLDDQRPHGFWQEPWYPSNIGNLTKGQRGTWRLESGGVATGVEGRALFKVDVPLAANVGGRTEFINFWWERPYIGGFRRTVIHTLQDPRTSDLPHPGPALVFVIDHGFTDIANMGSSPFEFLLAVPGAPLTAYTILKNEADAKHPSWVVEVRNAGISSTIPVRQELREEVRAAVPAASSFAVCPAPGLVEVFWVRPDGMVFTNARDPKLNGGAWNNPIPIAANPGSADPRSGVAAVCPAPGLVEVFWVRPDGMVFTNARDPNINGGAWNNPIPIAANPGSAAIRNV